MHQSHGGGGGGGGRGGGKRRVDTHERARASSYFEVDSYLVSKIFRVPATQACVYIAMRQIHRELILGKKRVERENRESRLRCL